MIPVNAATGRRLGGPEFGFTAGLAAVPVMRERYAGISGESVFPVRERQARLVGRHAAD